MVKVCKLIWASVSSGPIYSIHIHPDGTRYAFSQNNVVRILGMENIEAHIMMEKTQTLSSGTPFSSDFMNYLEAELFKITFHQNNVNIVRFSNCGKYLALGSDDSSVSIHQLEWKKKEDSPPPPASDPDEDGIVWDAPPTAGFDSPSVWKIGQMKMETWKLKKHLRDHQGMVLSLCWSDQVFASSSVDNTVCIYQVDSLELVHRIRAQYVVKGLTIDPVRKYLVCEGDGNLQSFDMSKSYELCGDITKDKSLEVMFCRPSFSPDGAYVLGTNTVQGRHHVVPFIERKGFDVKTYLRGHRGEVICTSFSPKLYYGSERRQYYSYFITGSMDKTICVWANFRDKPLLVIQLCYDKITDISWSKNGYVALCTSADGTIIHLQFTKEELGQVLEKSTFRKYMKQMYGSFGPNRMGIMEYPFKNTIAIPLLTSQEFARAKELAERHQRAVSSALLKVTGSKRKRSEEMRLEEDFDDHVSKKLKVNEIYYFGDRQVRLTNLGEVEVLGGPGKEEEELVWKAYVGEGVDKVVTNKNFTVVATNDKFLHIFSATGRRISPPILLDDTLKFIKCNSNFSFMILNENMDMFVYDVEKREKTMECNVGFFQEWGEKQGVFQSGGGGRRGGGGRGNHNQQKQKEESKKKNKNKNEMVDEDEEEEGGGGGGGEGEDPIDHVGLTENGCPVVVLKNNMCFMFDVRWKDWVRVSEDTASPYVSGVPQVYREAGRGSNNEILPPPPRYQSSVYHSVASVRHMMDNIKFTDMTDKLKKIDELESSIAIALNLGNSEEYANYINLYMGVLSSGEAQKIFENKIREMCDWFLGPGHSEGTWEDKVIGIPKRKILESVLGIVQNSKNYERLVQEFKSRLEIVNKKSMEIDDDDEL